MCMYNNSVYVQYDLNEVLGHIVYAGEDSFLQIYPSGS